MISLNKMLMMFFAMTVSSVAMVKAEDGKESVVVAKAEDGKENDTNELREYFDAAKKHIDAVISKIDSADVKEKLFSAEEQAQKFFTAYPTGSLAVGMFLAGKGWTNYEKANNPSKYSTLEQHLGLVTMPKETASQLEKGMRSSKDAFVRSCKKAGRRNMAAALFLVGGHVYYNRIQKDISHKNETVPAKDKDELQA